MKKKYIAQLIIAFLLIPSFTFGANTLWEFYQGQLPSRLERAKIALEAGIVSRVGEYVGTYNQNVALLKYLQGRYPKGDYLVVLEDAFSNKEVENPYTTFGADSGQRPSNFKTTLSRSLSATASTTETIYVSTLTTKDGHTLTSSDVGDFITFHINPGASTDEIISCTGVSTLSFTGCTRGYSFYSNSALSGNAKAHSPGETVIISNDDAWLKTQYTANDDDETIYGTWSFASTTAASQIKIGGGNTTYNKVIYANNGETNKPYLMYDEGNNIWSYSNDGLSSSAISNGASTYTAGAGIDITSSIVSLATSTAIVSWTGVHSFTGTSTLSKLSISAEAGNFYLRGYVLNVDGNELNILDGIATSTVTATNLNTLTTGATSNASALHYHATDCIGGMNYMLENVVAAQVISHGLGVAPTLIEITAMTGGGAEAMAQSFGYATSTSANNCTYSSHSNADAASVVAQSTSSIITLTNTSDVVSAQASISAISATTFTLNWTTNGTTGTNRFYTYKVCK